MNLVDLETFVWVAERGTITAAAAELGVPKSTVSRRVTRLEDELGVTLLHRAARSVSLTDHGEHLRARSTSALADLRAAERSLRDLHSEPTGLLRITAPPDLGRTPLITRVLVGFRRRWPKVRLEIELTSRVVDLVGEGFDIGLRPVHATSRWSGDGLRMRSLGALQGGFFAARTWLDTHGMPDHPSDLDPAQFIVHTAWQARGIPLSHAATGEGFALEGKAGVVTNDIGQVMQFVLAGAGVGGFPSLIAQRWLDRGELVPILTEWSFPASRLGLVWPAARHLSPRVRAFIDHAAAHIELAPA